MAITKDFQSDLLQLEQEIEQEDAQDAQAPEIPPSQRDVRAFEGFADTTVTPREIDGKPYEDSLD